MSALSYGFNTYCVVFGTKLMPSSALTGRRSCRWEHLALASFFVEISALYKQVCIHLLIVNQVPLGYGRAYFLTLREWLTFVCQ